MLEVDVKKRPTAEEVLQHAWFDGVDNSLNIFNEQEKNLMKKEFTYVMRKTLLSEQKNRSQSDLNTEFTEHSIGAVSAQGLQKNSETKEVMLCPFNSRQVSPREQSKLQKLYGPLLEEKESMIKFGFQVRDLDREYEMRNN